MNGLADYGKSIPVRILRDVVFVIGGICFLFVLNLIYKPDIESIPNVHLLTPGATYILGLSLAYAVGRILYIAGGFLFMIPYILISAFGNYPVQEGATTKTLLKIAAGQLTVLQKIEKHPELFYRFERLAHTRIFLTMLLATSAFLSYVTGHHWLYNACFVLVLIELISMELADDKMRSTIAQPDIVDL